MTMRLAGLLLFTAVFSCTISFSLSAQPQVLPALKSWQPADGQVQLTEQSRIVIPIEDKKTLLPTATLLQQDVQFIAGLALPIVFQKSVSTGDIQLKLANDPSLSSDEDYSLRIDKYIVISAQASAGSFYGTQTLLQMLKSAKNRDSVAAGQAVDQPDYPVRGIMLDVGRRYFQMDYLKSLMRNMAWLKLNTLHLHFTDWQGFRLQSETYPGLASEQAYSKQDIRRLQAIARRYHINLVPEIDLPAHATAITEFNPELGFECQSMRSAKWQGDEANQANKAWTIDITRQENRDWITALLNEFIPLFDSPYFHIGGDEFQYDTQKYQCPELMQAMKARGFEKPGDLFIEWMNETNELVKSHGKQTKIWNWWRYADNTTSIQPAKDIIIDVWNLPRQEQIIADGYQVVLTPETLLYVSPGVEGDDGYGIVDTQYIYESWEMTKQKNVMGYKVSIWSDQALEHADQWFEGKSVEARAVLAERVWGSKGSATVDGLLKRLSIVGNAPPLVEPSP